MESNIRVVVRCRPLSAKELSDNPQPTLMIPSAREIKLKGATERTYAKSFTFDRVFNVDATQDAVFDDVVVPMLHDVLLGYSCTIFAYGQTGTGKTHTMEGAMEIGHADSGLIPRAVAYLFAHLVGDYSVKLSCVELYNEEVSDLLGVLTTLAVFDAGKRGHMIQGLAEQNVSSATETMAHLSRANAKRKVGATNLNERSSRSHVVYTITVMVRETRATGEEVLRTGKINMVDLAGSENVGKSGSENVRAREACMINKSLLTLGRVISALVENQFVPYRDSKLTRILKDSLGGGTKTCIVATVSPYRGSLEETCNTLDYAYRAKNIRNRPELNEQIKVGVLITQYAAEIARLQTDLHNTRVKNGVYVDPSVYDALQLELKHKSTLISDLQLQIESMAQQQVTQSKNSCQLEQQIAELEQSAANSVAECTLQAEKIKTLDAKGRELEAMAIDHEKAILSYLEDINRLKRDLVAKDAELTAFISRRTDFVNTAIDRMQHYPRQLALRVGPLMEGVKRNFKESMATTLEALIDQEVAKADEQTRTELVADVAEYCASEANCLVSLGRQ